MKALQQDKIPTMTFKTKVLYLLWILSFLFILFMARTVISQTVNTNVRDPLLKEGQIFNLVITPASEKAEVFVTGSKIADMHFSEIGMIARVKVGNKVTVLSPKRGAKSFVIDQLPDSDTAKLQLNLKYRNEEEKFEVDLDQLK